MSLDQLISEYKTLPVICHQMDYCDKKSVRRNNQAVRRMYKIVEAISEKFGTEGTNKFRDLLDIKDHRTDLWAAVHMLEKMVVDAKTETKALKIIEKEAKDSLGMDLWLKEYREKSSKAANNSKQRL